MAVFTTWSDLLTQLRNDLASGNFARISSYTTPDGRSTTYRSIDDFWKLYREVEQRAAAEEGLAYAQVCTVPAPEVF